VRQGVARQRLPGLQKRLSSNKPGVAILTRVDNKSKVYADALNIKAKIDWNSGSKSAEEVM